jgi:hypothetical protein
MAAQYKPKEPMTAAVAILRPTVQNQFCIPEDGQLAETCSVYIFTTKRRGESCT